MAFAPLSVRRGKRAPFELIDGIPPHIKARLADWLQGHTYRHYHGPVMEVVDDLIARLQWPIVNRNPSERMVEIFTTIDRDDDAFLDALDFVCGFASPVDLMELDKILEAGLSRFRVSTTDPHCLEERLTEESRSAIARAGSGNDAAAEHIGQAWASAYGRDPEPTAAWNSAVKAVEFLLQPIVEPKAPRARLGTMNSVLRTKPDKWTFAVAGLDGDDSARLFLQASEIVGYEPGRHGTDPARATIEQARVVVLQAVTIVEWLRAGALKRKDA